MKKFLAAVMVIALLATMSLTAFAADETTTAAPIYVVYGMTQVEDGAKVAITATSTDASNGQTTFSKGTTPDGFFFDGWTNEGSVQLIGPNAKWSDETITVVGNVSGAVVTAHFTAIEELGTQKVAVFSWATGIMLPCGTADYTYFNSGSPIIKNPALLGKNLTINNDGTVTFTRTEKSGNEFVGGENKFVGWALDGEFEVIAGTATSDSLTVRIIAGRDIKGVDADGNYEDGQGNPIIVDNIFGAYEMYDVSGTVKGVAKGMYDALMLLHDHLIKLELPKIDLPVVPTKPVVTEKPAEDTTSPETGGSNLPALAVLALLTMTGVFIAKKHDA